MKITFPIRPFVIALTILCWAINAHAATTVQTLTHGWNFKHGEIQQEDFSADFSAEGWETVMVPHDWAVAGPFDETPDVHGGSGRLPWQGIARYRTTLEIPESDEHVRYYLDFDGVMANPKIYINGKLAGEWDYGYSPFRVDITDYVKAGETNILVVQADTRDWYSRWYPGAGIFRKVQLVTSPSIHIAKWGVFSRLADPEKPDRLHVEANIENHSEAASEVALRFELFDGKKVIQSSQVSVVVDATNSAGITTELNISDPILWDVDNPHLYTLKTHLELEGEIIDTAQTPVGLRTIKFTADDGFLLNGRRLQFKGVNLHHDLGPLGSAFNVSAARRQLEIMQSMGVNALRTSHNTPAEEILDLCDEMGIVVWDEAFDKWDQTAGRKAVDDPPLEPFGKRQLEALMLRDRNHPSVIVWSIGNEIPGGPIGITPENVELMVKLAKDIDDSRPIGMGCHIPELSYGGNFDTLDLSGWNYMARYRNFREVYPEKPIIYTESASTVSTRGYYAFPLPVRHTDTLESHHVTSYDLSAMPWSDIPDVEFDLMERDTFVQGEFVWTGIDYIGEPSPYEMTARSSYFGIADLCGFKKDRYYLYKSYWKPDETTIHILPHWNWPDRVGKNVPVFVYTNGDSAELFINGKSQGIRQKGVIPDRPANDAKTAVITCKQTDTESIPAFLNDENPDTIWKAGAPGAGQWIQLDLNEAKEVGYLGLHFEEPEKYFGYTIKGSLDGENWRLLVEKPKSNLPQWGGPKRIFHETQGTFRYLKIEFQKVNQEERARFVALREIMVASEPRESNYYDVTYNYRLRWNDVVYEPGEVKVVVYKNGEVLGEKSMHTVGAPASVRLTSDRDSIQLDNDELAFITVEVLDADGNPSPTAMNNITFQINENASIAGTGNGNPLSFESFQSETQSLWAGKALLIVRPNPNASGPIEITASAEGLESDTLRVFVTAE